MKNLVICSLLTTLTASSLLAMNADTSSSVSAMPADQELRVLKNFLKRRRRGGDANQKYLYNKEVENAANKDMRTVASTNESWDLKFDLSTTNTKKTHDENKQPDKQNTLLRPIIGPESIMMWHENFVSKSGLIFPGDTYLKYSPINLEEKLVQTTQAEKRRARTKSENNKMYIPSQSIYEPQYILKGEESSHIKSSELWIHSISTYQEHNMNLEIIILQRAFIGLADLNHYKKLPKSSQIRIASINPLIIEQALQKASAIRFEEIFFNISSVYALAGLNPGFHVQNRQSCRLLAEHIEKEIKNIQKNTHISEDTFTYLKYRIKELKSNVSGSFSPIESSYVTLNKQIDTFMVSLHALQKQASNSNVLQEKVPLLTNAIVNDVHAENSTLAKFMESLTMSLSIDAIIGKRIGLDEQIKALEKTMKIIKREAFT
jgi:hypothetical protein